MGEKHDKTTSREQVTATRRVTISVISSGVMSTALFAGGGVAQSSSVTVEFNGLNSNGVIEFKRKRGSDSVKEITGRVRSESDVSDAEFVIHESGSDDVVERLPVSVTPNNEFSVEWELDSSQSYSEFSGVFVVGNESVETVDIVFTNPGENAVTYDSENNGGVVKLLRHSDERVSGNVRYSVSGESYFVVLHKGEEISRERIDVSSSQSFSVRVDTREYPNGRVELRVLNNGDVIDSAKGVVVGSERSAEKKGEKEERKTEKREEKQARKERKQQEKSERGRNKSVGNGNADERGGGSRGVARSENANRSNRSNRSERAESAPGRGSEGVGNGRGGRGGVGSVLDSLRRLFGN